MLDEVGSVAAVVLRVVDSTEVDSKVVVEVVVCNGVVVASDVDIDNVGFEGNTILSYVVVEASINVCSN